MLEFGEQTQIDPINTSRVFTLEIPPPAACMTSTGWSPSGGRSQLLVRRNSSAPSKYVRTSEIADRLEPPDDTDPGWDVEPKQRVESLKEEALIARDFNSQEDCQVSGAAV